MLIQCTSCGGDGYNRINTGDDDWTYREETCKKCNGYGVLEMNKDVTYSYEPASNDDLIHVAVSTVNNKDPYEDYHLYICWECNGLGTRIVSDITIDCDVCKGKGIVKKIEKIKYTRNIPNGETLATYGRREVFKKGELISYD